MSSRFGNDEGYFSEDNTYGLWEGAFKQACGSRYGQKQLRQLRDALFALPIKVFVRGDVATLEGEVCAVGAFCAYKLAQESSVSMPEAILAVKNDWLRRVRSEIDAWEEYALLEDVTVQMGVAAGLRRTMAWELGNLNDETLGGCTPAERYKRVLAWIEKKLASE